MTALPKVASSLHQEVVSREEITDDLKQARCKVENAIENMKKKNQYTADLISHLEKDSLPAIEPKDPIKLMNDLAKLVSNIEQAESMHEMFTQMENLKNETTSIEKESKPLEDEIHQLEIIKFRMIEILDRKQKNKEKAHDTSEKLKV